MAERSAVLTGRRPSADELLGALVSSATGILKRVGLLPAVGGQLPFAHFTALPADYSQLPTGGAIANPGASAPDIEVAKIQVVFEAIERYCAAFVDYSALLHAPGRDAGFDAGVRIQQFASFQYDSPGFPFVPIRRDVPINWVLGRSLLTGERRYVAAGHTFLPYKPASPAEVLGPTFSTGMAAGWTRDEACLSGLLELVERDAFAITWMNRRPGTRLVPAPGGHLASLVEEVERDGATRVTFVDIRTDIDIPVVCALLERRTLGRDLVNVGLSCKWDTEAACVKALCEAVSDHERLRVALADSSQAGWTPGENFRNVVDFEWHGRLFVDAAMQPHLDFLLHPETDALTVPTEPVPTAEALNAALREVARVASDVVMVDLTTRDIADLGVRAVKVFSPELVPLNADHAYHYLGHERLYTVGGRLPGRTPSPEAAATFNPVPHPFS
jgi:ribosomal protein S12 methylthiotransferase accessory factor